MTGSKENKLLNVDVCDGKYTVIQDKRGGIVALRYGNVWRDCCGDGLILALAQEVRELREKETPFGELLVTQAKYIKLLGEEIDSMVPMAHTHGWRSKNYKKGEELRKQILDLQQKLIK